MESFMNYTILRNNTQFSVNLWNLRNSDLVLAQNGYFYPVYSFPELRKYFPQPTTPKLSEIVDGIGITVLITVSIVGVAIAVGSLLQPAYNDKPLTHGIRDYIRERDGEICNYCEVYAPNGHVDHRISRANGGSNNFDNLTWACVSCNCSKGSMNDYDFIQYFEWC